MKKASPGLVLAIAIAGISFAGPLTRLSDAHPLAIATWRMIFAIIIVALFLIPTGSWRELQKLAWSDTIVGIVAGVLLALHFWSWNASIELTSVSASVFLVNLQPVFVALLSVVWLREKPAGTQWGGIAVALFGAMVIALGQNSGGTSGGTNPPLGNALALIGAITAAIYYSSGRKLRRSLSLWPYVALVYGACLITLLVMVVGSGVSLGPYPRSEFAIFAALALGPMMLGHTGMNYALRYMPAYVVNIAVLGEPVGATILAAILPGIKEMPSIATILGGGLILTGMVLTLPRTRTSTATDAGA